MRERTLIGPWIRRFLLEHLVADRNLAGNTQASYRDTLLLLLPFASRARKLAIDRLKVDDLSPALLRSFLEHLEKERGCSGDSQSTPRRDPLTRKVRRYAKPGTFSLVYRDPRCSIQEDTKIHSYLPKQAGNRCTVESARLANVPWEARLRTTTVPLQHRGARRRSCSTDDRRYHLGQLSRSAFGW